MSATISRSDGHHGPSWVVACPTCASTIHCDTATEAQTVAATHDAGGHL